MASYAYFDTKRKIKRHPEIGCIFYLGGCKTRKKNGSSDSQPLLNVMPDGEFPKTEQQNTGRKTSSLPVSYVA